MTDYTSIANSQIDPKAPVTSELMTALRDNPIAIAEGAAGAPKIADKVLFASQTGSGHATVTGLGDFSGCFVDVSAYIDGDEFGSSTVSFEVTDNGSTWYGGTSLLTSTDTDHVGSGRLFLDFSTGAYHFVGTSAGTNDIRWFASSGTVSGASLSITGIRMNRATNSSGRGTAIIVQPQGGLAP